MTKIEFNRIERDSDWNKKLRAEGDTRGIIYDWNVLIDGEHRVTFARNIYHSGYELHAATHRAYYEAIKEKDGYSSSVEVKSKAKFEETISRLLEAGRIPTLQQITDKRRATVLKQIKKRADAREARRVRQIEDAGVPMYEALKPIAEFLKNNGGDAAFHDADGTGWLTRAQAAIARAEGRAS